MGFVADRMHSKRPITIRAMPAGQKRHIHKRPIVTKTAARVSIARLLSQWAATAFKETPGLFGPIPKALAGRVDVAIGPCLPVDDCR